MASLISLKVGFLLDITAYLLSFYNGIGFSCHQKCKLLCLFFNYFCVLFFLICLWFVFHDTLGLSAMYNFYAKKSVSFKTKQILVFQLIVNLSGSSLVEQMVALYSQSKNRKHQGYFWHIFVCFIVKIMDILCPFQQL